MENNENPYFSMEKDKAFKYLFSKPKYAEDLINSFYEYIKEDKKIKVDDLITHKSLVCDNKLSKISIVDILVKLKNGELIDLEMYLSAFGLEEYLKSLMYLSNVFAHQLKEGQSYKEVKKVTVINFVNSNFAYENKWFINRYGLANKDTFTLVKNDYLEFVIVRIDKVKTRGYTKDMKRFEHWCKILKAKSLEEVKILGKDDKIMEMLYNDISSFNSDIMINTDMSSYLYERRKNLDEGMKLGRKEGINQRNLEVARNMLYAGESKDKVQLYTGLSEKEIEKITCAN